MRKTIICDGDQTIYKDVKTPIDDRMLSLIKSLIEKGYCFGVISGTDAEEISRLIRSRDINLEHHILGNSGAAYYKFNGNLEKVYEIKIEEQDKRIIFSALDKLIDRYKLVPLTSKDDQILDRESQITLSILGRNAPMEEKDRFDVEMVKRTEYVKFLRAMLQENRYGIKIGGTTSIDISIGEIDKGWGVKKFAEYNDINLRNILFFGDKLMPGGNDHSVVMLRTVKCISVKDPENTIEKILNLHLI